MYEIRLVNKAEKVEPPCSVCQQHLELLNHPGTGNGLKPLIVHNLETHMHFSHGVGYRVGKYV